MKTKRKNIELAILFGLICAMLIGMGRFDNSCRELREGVLRLHIRANSDEADDQSVKLKVRDALLEAAGEMFSDDTELASAEHTAEINISELSAVANCVLIENGFDYNASVSIGDEYFENRKYKDFTLPAGSYRSLIVKLGEGKGENWWCVVFPAVCIPAAESASLSDSISESGCRVAEQPERYVMQFKIVEIYENIKHFFV